MGCNTLDDRCNFQQSFDSAPIYVCEHFVSIQGEGRDSGAHALFIRLAGCNLACPWCDTKYSWKPGKDYSQQGIINLLKAYKNRYRNNYVVWTGGEPLLQEMKIYSVIDQTREFYHLLETNGTIIPEKPHLFNAIAVSPKPGQTFDGKRWVTIRNAYVKLVVDSISEAVTFQKVYEFPSQWFFVMAKTPQSYRPIDFPALIQKEKEIFKGCIDHGFNYSPRLQIYFESK